MNTVVVSLVKSFHDVCQDGRILSAMVSKATNMQHLHWHTFPARSTYRHPIPRFEKLSLGDRVVNFRFEDVEEAFFADLLAGFGALEDRAGFRAESARFGSHSDLLAGRWYSRVGGMVIERVREEVSSSDSERPRRSRSGVVGY